MMMQLIIKDMGVEVFAHHRLVGLEELVGNINEHRDGRVNIRITGGA
jgi:hypothetical protein